MCLSQAFAVVHKQMIIAENHALPVTSKVINVLLVEDNLIDACYVQTLLPVNLYKVMHVEKLSQAHACVKTDSFDIVMLDLAAMSSRYSDYSRDRLR